MIFPDEVPDPVPAEIEAQLPEELQRISNMKDPYQRWLDARAKWHEEEGDTFKPSEDTSAKLRAAIMDMLYLVHAGKATMPRDMAFSLAEAINELSAGQSETFLLPGRKLENRKQFVMHPSLNDWRQDAVNYLSAVKCGDIVDNHPIHTVATNYGVHRRTVHTWWTKLSGADIPESDREHLQLFMRASGKHYRNQTKRHKKKK